MKTIDQEGLYKGFFTQMRKSNLVRNSLANVNFPKTFLQRYVYILHYMPKGIKIY